ncbi:hypothetical protein B0H11DRAFT_170123 [Mycena galericulata]|nr:hypothetical protein B0H11DRAFT_170123 [Mycena galericulata]
MSHLTLAASLLPIAFILISHSLLARTVSVPLQNITITAPIGTSQHGDAHLLCVPTGTWDVIVFFLGNYIAHAFTVRAYPGESLIDFTWATIAALFLPTSGIIRGATGIIRGTTGILRKGFVARTPLEMAARAGALCMVVRTKDWKPHPGFQLSQIGIRMIDPAKSATRPWFRRRLQWKELDSTKPLPHAYGLAPSTYPDPVHVSIVPPTSRWEMFPDPISGSPDDVPATSLLSTIWHQVLPDHRDRHSPETPRRILTIRELLLLISRGLFLLSVFLFPASWIIRGLTPPSASDDAHVPLHAMLSARRVGNTRTLIPATYRTYVPPWLKDVSFGSFLPDTLVVLTGTRKIRGNQKLPQGYAFAFVPSDTRVVPLDNGDGHTVPPPKKGLLKGLIALGQAAYGSYTLVMSLGGDQISQYGYAASQSSHMLPCQSSTSLVCWCTRNLTSSTWYNPILFWKHADSRMHTLRK